MKKLLALSVLALFYIITQQNFADNLQYDKTCSSLQTYAKSCEKILNTHLEKIKFIEQTYPAGTLNHTVNLTAQNSSYIESYQSFSRELNTVTTENGRSPASSCTIEKNLKLKTCFDQVKKIYEGLVPVQTNTHTKN